VRLLASMAGGALLGLVLFMVPASADIAVVSTDGHTVTIDGVQQTARPAKPDSVSLVDLAHYPPRIIATIEAPGSVVGPPMAVAVAKDESYAIVTSATKLDPADPGKVAPDDRISVIDLRARPPKIVQQLNAGAGATVVRITPDGGLALVANRTEGTVSLFTIKDRRLEAAGKLDLGNPKAGPSGIVVTRDGKDALVTRDGDSMVSVLHIDGTAVTIDPRPITTGMRPYTIDINRDGTLAAVSNMGRGDGDRDVVSLIDLTAKPYRTVEQFGVPGSPEGLKFSPDGKILAVGSQNGTTKAKGTPFFREHGTLTLLAVKGKELRKLAEAPVGGWSQGIVFAKDGRTILVENMTQENISVFRWEDGKLTQGKPLATGAGPAAIQTAWP